MISAFVMDIGPGDLRQLDVEDVAPRTSSGSPGSIELDATGDLATFASSDVLLSALEAPTSTTIDLFTWTRSPRMPTCPPRRTAWPWC
jgi:hypothetical protein